MGVSRIVTCACGRKHTTYHGADVHCECGRWYNAYGQALNPPEMWGEETGERFNAHGQYIGGGEDE